MASTDLLGIQSVRCAVVATGGERFIALSNGDYQTCALREDGTPACWDSLESSFDLERTPVGERFSAIRMGSGASACGIRDDGSVSCWGEEFMPEYLQGERFIDISFRRTAKPAPCSVTAPRSAGDIHHRRPWTRLSRYRRPDNGPFTAISVGRHHTCALRTDGTPSMLGARCIVVDRARALRGYQQRGRPHLRAPPKLRLLLGAGGQLGNRWSLHRHQQLILHLSGSTLPKASMHCSVRGGTIDDTVARVHRQRIIGSRLSKLSGDAPPRHRAWQLSVGRWLTYTLPGEVVLL